MGTVTVIATRTATVTDIRTARESRKKLNPKMRAKVVVREPLFSHSFFYPSRDPCIGRTGIITGIGTNGISSELRYTVLFEIPDGMIVRDYSEWELRFL